MPDGPFEPAFTPDGRWIFVTALNANRVAVVDTRDWSVRVLPEHAGFGQPHGIALSPDGSRVFVGNRHQLGGVHDHAGGKPDRHRDRGRDLRREPATWTPCSASATTRPASG